MTTEPASISLIHASLEGPAVCSEPQWLGDLLMLSRHIGAYRFVLSMPSLVRALVRTHRRCARRRERDRARNRRHGLRTSPDIAPGYRSHRKTCSQ